MMRRRTRSRSRPVVGCLGASVVLVALALAACTDPDTASPPDGDAGAATPGDTSDAADQQDTESRGSTQDPTPCVDSQRRAINRSRNWGALIEVSTSPTGVSWVASRIMRREASRVADRLLEGCDRLPAPARPYLQVVRELTARPMGDAELDLLLDAWLRWASAVDRPADAQKAIDHLRQCREYEKGISVAYRVLWAWTDTGKRWWIELTIDNQTGHRADGSTHGRAEVTGALRAGESPPVWGGSSGDQLFMPNGISHLHPVGTEGVLTTGDGGLELSDIWVSLGPRDGSSPRCSLPVPHAP